MEIPVKTGTDKERQRQLERRQLFDVSPHSPGRAVHNPRRDGHKVLEFRFFFFLREENLEMRGGKSDLEVHYETRNNHRIE
jgi:hypothetical protein